MKRWAWIALVVLMALAMSAMLRRSCRSSHDVPTPKQRVARATIVKAIAESEKISDAYARQRDAVVRGELRLEGVVVDLHGEPVAGALVRFEGALAFANMSEIRTETDGWFAIDGIAAGGYLLTATATAMATAETHGAQAADNAAGFAYYQLGAGTEPAVIVVRPTVAVGVTVLRGGAPVAGADVQLEGVIGAAGRTDASGVFVAKGMIPGGIIVRASAPGLAQAVRYAHVSRGGAQLQLDLFAATEIAGVVVDEAGAPIAGADIALALSDLTMRDDGAVAVTDDRGAFVVRVMTGEVVRLVATHRDFLRGFSDPVVAAQAAAVAAPVRLVLGRGGVLRGKVTDASGAGVVANVTLYEEPPSDVARRQRTTRTAADGAFAFSSVQAAAISLRAENERGRSELWSAEAPPSDVVSLVLDDDHRISGSVVDSAGQTVAGGKVVAHRGELDLQYGNEVSAVADADGNYVLQGIGPGSYRVAASDPKADIDIREMANAVTAKAGDEGVVVVAGALAEVRGKVVNADGSGIDGMARLVVQLGNHSVVVVAGAFALRDVPPGTYRLQIRSDGVIAGFRGPVTVASPLTDLGEIALVMPSLVRGVVRDVAGAPVSGALVSAGARSWLGEATLGLLANNDTVAQAWSRGDGSFELAVRDFGDTAVRADLAHARSSAMPIAGQEGVVLVVHPAGIVVGRVVDAKGNPVARAVIGMANGGEEIRAWAGYDGMFALVAHPAGDIFLRVDGEAGGIWVRVLPGQTASVVLRSQD